MGSAILDGKLLAQETQAKIKGLVDKGKTLCSRVPGLGVILVGDNPGSHTYVANKEKVASQCGFLTVDKRLPKDASQNEVAKAIEEYNLNPNIDGILLQLPLPSPLSSDKLISLIHPDKDADGLHPLNQGLLISGKAKVYPCTPLGVIKLLELALSRKDFGGLNAVVLGRSILVGKPLSLMLLERNATVTVVHSKTRDAASITSKADIVVAAIGVPKMVGPEWIKEGAVVIDVGINRLSSGKLVGDVDFEKVSPKTLAITPVPGGVGPMTVAMLMVNTLKSYWERESLAEGEVTQV